MLPASLSFLTHLKPAVHSGGVEKYELHEAGGISGAPLRHVPSAADVSKPTGRVPLTFHLFVTELPSDCVSV